MTEFKIITKVAEHNGKDVYFNTKTHDFVIFNDNKYYTGNYVSNVCYNFDNGNVGYFCPVWFGYRSGEVISVVGYDDYSGGTILFKITPETYDVFEQIEHYDRQYSITFHNRTRAILDPIPGDYDYAEFLKTKINHSLETHSHQIVTLNKIQGLNNNTKEVEYSIDGINFFSQIPYNLINDDRQERIKKIKQAGCLFFDTVNNVIVDNPNWQDFTKIRMINPSCKDIFLQAHDECLLEKNRAILYMKYLISTISEFEVKNPHAN